MQMSKEQSEAFQEAVIALLKVRNLLVEHRRAFDAVNRLGMSLGTIRRELESA